MSLSNWCERIEQKLKKGGKIVLLTGASSSGKGFCAKALKDNLESKGNKVAVIAADMYYKGISRIITEKSFLSNQELQKYLPHISQIVKCIRNIIEFQDFANKFTDKNLEEIKNSLQKFLSYNVALKLAEELKIAFSQINFDEPSAIDFKKLTRDINELVSGRDIVIPEYSFKTGESRLYKKNAINFKNYDYVIIEGLYVLRNEVLSEIDSKSFVKAAIDCDLKTLLIRRFNRDIKGDRCAYPPEQVINSFITQVMPAYYEYIHPTLKNADIILHTSVSKKEIEDRDKSLQFKYITSKIIYELLELNGTKLLDIENHRDYFLEDIKREHESNIVLRLREEKGLATKLSIKIKTDNEDRAIEEYDLKSCLSLENRKVNLLLEKFKKSGYEIMQVISKKRFNYEYKGIKFKLDDVKDLGQFVELDGDLGLDLEELKKSLLLNDYSVKSYYDLYKSNIPNMIHNECEMKFILKGLKDNWLKNYTSCNIKQYYLDLKNNKVIDLLNRAIDKKINFKVNEARIRIVDGDVIYLTIKSDGDKVRREMEKEIPVVLSNDLIKYVKGVVDKVRYFILEESERKVEIDFYKDRNLYIMEIEYNDKRYSEDEIEEFANKLLNQSIQIQNVTTEAKYKNRNLAFENQ